ncbi:hypothetical protein PUNSTDRAFT_97325 [Punctularia strigosozonata HHB-11173 SS5]|uniref:uncharacterized protein n=1 Tax=Punctularia strigosozonata (strain HHB-11173) TaxID=741275 RepID=UPI00044175EF|nr:uncharacterized protein PUNSTDRAFT_97325 [Punctularia strigosozonata HHB-11173 SS5]EIN12550.1 hypothetical protein PUNSTDRAFT_97325 [Punctularia strigosozonata HHB-11173 SS5]
MAIIDGGAATGGGGGDQELLRLWGLVAELSEQLSLHRQAASALHAQVGDLKTQAIHSQTGFVLRRFNTDKSDEEYETELKRMNAALGEENSALANENKQLGALIKEYEQTLENVMDAFRKRAHEVQVRELSLIREYEARLMDREDAELGAALGASAAVSQSVGRMSRLLRRALRAAQGEDGYYAPADVRARIGEEEWAEAGVSEWALERECELARVERENEELRRLLAMREQMRAVSVPQQGSGQARGAGLPDLRKWIGRGQGRGEHEHEVQSQHGEEHSQQREEEEKVEEALAEKEQPEEEAEAEEEEVVEQAKDEPTYQSEEEREEDVAPSPIPVNAEPEPAP